MTSSESSQPDLDWSQIKETIKLLTVSVALVQTSMKEGDSSVNTLTESFSAMVEHMNAISGILNNMESSDERDCALQHCHATHDRIQASIIAFQFYDRLQQCLDHVVHNLDGLSAVIADPQRLYNPFEWKKFQNEIRQRYTMESEKIMFDAILKGKTMEEAIALASSVQEKEEDDIELF